MWGLVGHGEESARSFEISKKGDIQEILSDGSVCFVEKGRKDADMSVGKRGRDMDQGGEESMANRCKIQF